MLELVLTGNLLRVSDCGLWRYSFLPSILIKDSIHCSVQTYRTVNRFLMQDLTFASPCGSQNGYFQPEGIQWSNRMKTSSQNSCDTNIDHWDQLWAGLTRNPADQPSQLLSKLSKLRMRNIIRGPLTSLSSIAT